MSSLGGLLNNLRARFEGENVPFAIGGTFALAARGHPRQTDDLDIMVDAPTLDPVHRALTAERCERINEVTFRDSRTGLHLDLIPVRDKAQRHAFEDAARETVGDASDIPVLTAEGLAIMLLREATHGDPERRPLRLRDIELLATGDLDWEPVAEWTRRMGYEDAYRDVRADDKPSVGDKDADP